MDRYEYKVRAEEIKALIARREFSEAMAIADTIDWRRVKSVMMLCTVSDLYKMNRRFEECKELLLLAYDRHPGGRMIVYSLCELAIKMHETVQAIEYYKEFVQIAPKDSGRYILQYKLYEAQEVSLEERIAVLEEMKRRDYREKWAYELAYLYHRVGLGTRCVEECDELILWFGEGKYVTKAMELKMLHQPLSAAQEEKYRLSVLPEQEEAGLEDIQEEIPMPIEIKAQDVSDSPTMEIPAQDMDIQVQTVKVGQYDTINLQKELAESMKELLQETETPEETELEYEGPGEITQAIVAPLLEETENLPPIEEVKEIFFEDSTAEMERPVFEQEEEFFQDAEQVDWDTEPVAQEDAVELEAAQTAEEGSNADETEYNMAQLQHDFSQMLSQEYDGQLSIVMPGSAQVEKQITGQMSIEDILAEWEKMKKENEQKRAEEVRQRVLEHTGSLFSEFDAQTRSGILAQLDEVYENTLKEQSVKQEIPELVIEEVGEDPEESIGETEVSAEAPELFAAETDAVGDEDASLYEMTEDLDESEIYENGEEPAESEIYETGEESAEPEMYEPDEESAEPEMYEPDEESAEPEMYEPDEESAEPEMYELDEEPAEPEIYETGEESAEPEIYGPDEESAGPGIIETDGKSAEEGIYENLGGKLTEEEMYGKSEEPAETEAPEMDDAQNGVRNLTDDERELFGSFIQTKREKHQIVQAIDSISLATYTGNVIITGEPGSGTVELAKNLIKEVQMSDANFSGKVAKITGKTLNTKNVENTLFKMNNGALIIEKAGDMQDTTLDSIRKYLEKGKGGIIIILEDTAKAINRILESGHKIQENFSSRIDITALNNDALVNYGKRYAQELEYSIDELGVLALYTRIADMQTSEHVVSAADIREIVDEAIDHANRKNLKHFMDILLAKRYDDEDMIILREHDFI